MTSQDTGTLPTKQVSGPSLEALDRMAHEVCMGANCKADADYPGAWVYALIVLASINNKGMGDILAKTEADAATILALRDALKAAVNIAMSYPVNECASRIRRHSGIKQALARVELPR